MAHKYKGSRHRAGSLVSYELAEAIGSLLFRLPYVPDSQVLLTVPPYQSHFAPMPSARCSDREWSDNSARPQRCDKQVCSGK